MNLPRSVGAVKPTENPAQDDLSVDEERMPKASNDVWEDCLVSAPSTKSSSEKDKNPHPLE
jgi:hypothetical protein